MIVILIENKESEPNKTCFAACIQYNCLTYSCLYYFKMKVFFSTIEPQLHFGSWNEIPLDHEWWFGKSLQACVVS